MRLNRYRKQILQFFKTDHFLQRQWEHKIDDSTLRKILPYICDKVNEKTVVIITPGFILKKGISSDTTQCLVIITYQNILKTVYYSDHPDYLFKKEKEANFKIMW